MVHFCFFGTKFIKMLRIEANEPIKANIDTTLPVNVSVNVKFFLELAHSRYTNTRRGKAQLRSSPIRDKVGTTAPMKWRRLHFGVCAAAFSAQLRML
jgi:hypothetical protein